MLTAAEIIQALPANLRTAVTPQFVNTVNTVTTDPLIAEQVRENFISYSRVMAMGKFKVQDYLNAVTYVSYKLMGDNNQEAYCKTFPQRHADLLAKGASAKVISSYVSAYNGNQLVNLIYEQSMIPAWVMNQDIHQKAINHLATLMIGATSEKVQCDAAGLLLAHLGKPKETNFQLNIGITENSGMTEMRQQIAQMAEMQQQFIEAGVEITQIAKTKLIEGELV